MSALPDPTSPQVAEYLLAVLIALIGFAVARDAGATLRAVVHAPSRSCAVAIAVVKNLLAGHDGRSPSRP